MRDRRVKFIKQYKGYRPGDIAEVRSAELKHVLRTGVAVMSKDMTSADYQTAQPATKAAAKSKTAKSAKRQGF